jgi:hypothetical protein
MPSTTVKRSQFATFLNTGTTETPVWSLIGDGITTAAIEYNPQTSEEIYIHQDSGTTEIESYKPTMPLEASCKSGDAVFDAVDALRQSRAVLANAQKEVLLVYLYETPALGEYPAERQAVSVQIDNFGGDGGTSNKINFTLNFRGDPTLGTYNPTSGAFTPNPNLAGLSALTIGSLVFTPVFSTNQLFYAVTTAISPQNISSTAVDGDAVIVQKNGVTVIAQGGAATFATGVNHVTVEVTVGTEVVTYHVDVTKTA